MKPKGRRRKMAELLCPKVDFVFKRIFGTEENRDVLAAFLNAVLKSAPGREIAEVEILNPYIDKEALGDKMSVLDVRARIGDGTLVNIEIQLTNRYDMEKRTLYYWSRLYSGQLAEGQGYRELKKTIAINILDFAYLPGKRYHYVFHLREDGEPGLVLSEDLEIHFLELPKLEQAAYGLEDRLVRWLLFIRGVGKERWDELASNEPALRKAMTTLEFLSQDREARMLYEMRQKALRDHISAIEGAREQGRLEGRERGRLEGRVEVARNMLAMGLDVELIAQATGLAREKLEELKNQTQ